MLLIGLFLFALGAGRPRMQDADWQVSVKEGDSAAYFRAYESNLTPAARRHDVGVGLVSMGLSLLALIAATQAWSVKRLAALETPKRRWVVVLLCNGAWLYAVWASQQQLMLQFQREEFPPWADSMGIPLAGLGIVMIFGLIVINIGVAVYLYGATLPTALWTRPKGLRSFIVNGGVGIALLACAWAGYDSIVLGDISMPPAVVAVTYLLLVGRAAASPVALQVQVGAARAGCCGGWYG